MFGGDQNPLCLFFGLVVIARAKHPIPSRTRQLSAVAPMVLRLKTWESRSLPNLKRDSLSIRYQKPDRIIKPSGNGAGWSSPVARQAHNLKVVSSNLAPATKIHKLIQRLIQSPAWLSPAGLLLVSALCPFLGPFRNTNARRRSNSERNRVR